MNIGTQHFRKSGGCLSGNMRSLVPPCLQFTLQPNKCSERVEMCLSLGTVTLASLYPIVSGRPDVCLSGIIGTLASTCLQSRVHVPLWHFRKTQGISEPQYGDIGSTCPHYRFPGFSGRLKECLSHVTWALDFPFLWSTPLVALCGKKVTKTLQNFYLYKSLHLHTFYVSQEDWGFYCHEPLGQRRLKRPVNIPFTF